MYGGLAHVQFDYVNHPCVWRGFESHYRHAIPCNKCYYTFFLLRPLWTPVAAMYVLPMVLIFSTLLNLGLWRSCKIWTQSTMLHHLNHDSSVVTYQHLDHLNLKSCYSPNSVIHCLLVSKINEGFLWHYATLSILGHSATLSILEHSATLSILGH